MKPINEPVVGKAMQPVSSNRTLIQDLHAKFNGECQSCGQRMDKHLARYLRVNADKLGSADNAVLVCPNCFRNRPNPALGGFSAEDAVIARVTDATGWNEVTAVEWLSGFAKRCALIVMNTRGFRRYWSWEHQEPFRIVDVQDRRIVRVRMQGKTESVELF